jgi:hypothetical protein
VTGDDLGKLFTTFRRTAFRLETLPAYDVTEDAERDAYRRWQTGQQPPAQERDWPKLVASAVGSGKTMQRVRIVRELTDYIRFEMEWGYLANVAAGEDIRVLELADDVPGMVDHDYWLFDEATVVRLEYAADGSFIRPAEVSAIEPYRRCCDLAMRLAVPFREYRPSLFI